MKRGTKLLAAGLLLTWAAGLSQCKWSPDKDVKKDLVKALENNEEKKAQDLDSIAKFPFKQPESSRIVEDTVETKEDNCFSVNIADLEWTPLFWSRKMITPNYWNLLGFSQAETIIRDYNEWHAAIDPTDRVSPDETINIPLIYPELKSYFPENWSDLIEEFPEYWNISIPHNDLIFIARCDNWKSALAYYKDGKLTLATYVSLGNNRQKKAIRTPSWIFTLTRAEIRRVSTTFRRSPMPYSIHVEWAWNWWVYLHQWYVNWFDQSHGCWRVPWLYQKHLHENLPKQTVWIFHKLYNPTLRKH